jgi:hypothetical protein
MDIHTPAKGDESHGSIVPPSTIQRMMGYVWSAGPTEVTKEDRHRAMPGEHRVQNRLLDRLRAARDEDNAGGLREVRHMGGTPVTIRQMEEHATTSVSTTPRTAPPQLAESELTSVYPPASSWTPPSRPSHSLITISRPAKPPTPPAVFSADSASTSYSTPKIYPSLQPSLARRTTAIRALFPEVPSSMPLASASSTPISIPIKHKGKGKESPSVKDLVRSFEDGGLLTKSLVKGKSEEGLRRVQSRGI